MVEYRNAKGLAFELGDSFPIFDDEDNIIGHTKAGDIAVVTFEEEEGSDIYAEATIATGEFAGYTGLTLKKEDIKNCVLLQWPCGGTAYLRDIPLATC